MVCERCLVIVAECACCACGDGGCSCGMTICARCAEVLCDEGELVGTGPA
ncbi:MAG: hypothetical protein ACRDJO_12655 [Actinomycetota bacterium]